MKHFFISFFRFSLPLFSNLFLMLFIVRYFQTRALTPTEFKWKISLQREWAVIKNETFALEFPSWRCTKMERCRDGGEAYRRWISRFFFSWLERAIMFFWLDFSKLSVQFIKYNLFLSNDWKEIEIVIWRRWPKTWANFYEWSCSFTVSFGRYSIQGSDGQNSFKN